MKISTFTVVILLLVAVGPLKAQRVFSDLQSFLQYAEEKSTSIQSGRIEFDKAKKAKLAAIAGIPDPTGNMDLKYTNNAKLPVTLFPSELIGGEAGTYTPVAMGVQYNTNFTQTTEIKLINLQGWEGLKSAKLNIEATDVNNKITRKSLYNDIASSYFNVVQLQEQLRCTEENLLANDTLLRIAANKYKEGLLKVQDVNDTRVNYLNTKENINQIRYMIEQQYLTLKLLADIPDSDSIVIQHGVSAVPTENSPTIEKSSLDIRNSVLNEKLAASTFRKNKYSKLPTLSFFLSETHQQYNTRREVFDSNVNWMHSKYFGFKISFPLPSASMIASTSESRYNYLLAKKSSEKAQIQSDLQYRQLGVDYDKAWSKFVSNKEIFALKKDSYYKNLNLFQQGLTDTNQVLTSFNAMVNSNYELITSTISVLLAVEKIEINNTIK